MDQPVFDTKTGHWLWRLSFSLPFSLPQPAVGETEKGKEWRPLLLALLLALPLDLLRLLRSAMSG
jgi:hypothetical protein